jgi:hypothetical protein
MAKTKSNPKAAARRKAPIAGSRTASSGSANAVSENPSSSVNAGRTRGTKQNLIIGLLQREEGASLGQLVEATGWLPPLLPRDQARPAGDCPTFQNAVELKPKVVVEPCCVMLLHTEPVAGRFLDPSLGFECFREVAFVFVGDKGIGTGRTQRRPDWLLLGGYRTPERLACTRSGPAGRCPCRSLSHE